MAERIRGNDIGPIGQRLGDQVRRIRGDLDITQSELSRRLSAHGRPIPVASIGRMESGQRKIDVDDLMAIAYVLDVSPLALLLPFTESPSDEFRPAGVGKTMDALTAWQWASGDAPHHYDSGNPDYQMSTWSQFRSRSHPWWLTLTAELNDRLIRELRRLPAFPKTDRVVTNPLYDGQPGTSDAEWYRREEDGDGVDQTTP